MTINVSKLTAFAAYGPAAGVHVMKLSVYVGYGPATGVHFTAISVFAVYTTDAIVEPPSTSGTRPQVMVVT